MKTTHGTKAVKDQDDEEHESKQDKHWKGSDVVAPLVKLKLHVPLEPELRAALSDACQRGFSRHRPRTHSSCEELEQDIIEQLGGSLQFYWRRFNKSPNLDAVVVNFLTRAKEEEGSIQ